MGFFNSLYQIGKNNNNFKVWEQDQRDTAAKREELYKRKQHSEDEIEKAKELGKTIIDIVDIMDNHSENVAENVETATAPVVAIAPFAMFLGSGFLFTKFLAPKKYDEIHEIKKDFVSQKKNIKLFKEIEEYFNNADAKYKNLDEFDKRYRTTPAENKGWYSPMALTNKRAIERIKNPVLKTKANNVYKEFLKKTASQRRAVNLGAWGVLASWIGTFIGANIFATKLQVDSSRIARYQARETLSDPKAFVSYTPEQIAQAQEYIKQHPELLKKKKKEKLKSGMFKSIINVLKDRKAYKQAKADNVDQSKKVDRPLSAQELKKAKQDQEVIQRAVRLINNEAEKYSANMETTADILFGTTPILGASVGFLINKIANWTGITDKIVKNIVEKNTTEETKKAYQEFAKLEKGAPGYTKKFIKFVDKIMDEVTDNNIDENSKKIKPNIMAKVKKVFAAGLAHQKGRAILLAGISGITTGIAGALIALKLQKSSARAGRFTAKRELEKDPRNFIGYTEEDFEEVKNIKGKKPTFLQKAKDYALFVPRVLKQYYAYSKYKKHEFKENQLINEQLQKADVSDKQLKDAKNLQRKLFNTFEKVDDNSQQYSESMEAAIEIAQPFVITGGVMAMAAPFMYLALQTIKGKKNPAELLNKIAGYLSSGSKIMESKYFKKYIQSISQNIEHKVGNIDVENKYLGKVLKGVNLKEDYVPDIVNKMINNIHEASNSFRTKGPEEQTKILMDLQYSLSKYTEKIDSLKNAALSVNEKETLSLQKNIENILSHFINDYDLIQNPSVRADILDILTGNTKYIKDKMSKEEFSNAINYIAMYGAKIKKDFEPIEFANQITKEKYLEILENIPSLSAFKYKLSEIPQAIDGLTKIVPESAIAESPALTRIKKTLNLKNPKTLLNDFKASVEKLDDEQFAEKMSLIGFSSMDKKTCLEIIPKVEKILDRIPEKELKQIMDALIKEFNAHPDEVLKMLNNGQIREIFNTPYLRKVIITLGLTNTAFFGALTAFVSFVLADLQLKAGRLGVMKAIDSLEDPAYYADIESDKPQPPALQTTLQTQAKSKSLIEQMMKH